MLTFSIFRVGSMALTGIVKANLVPESLLDTIHHDYVTCEEERRYYCEFLDNNELTSDEIRLDD